MRRMKLIAGLLSIAMAVPMLNLLSTGKSVRAFSGGENTITSVTLNNSRGMTPTPTNTPVPGSIVPSFTFEDTSGNQYTVGQGKATVLIYGNPNDVITSQTLESISKAHWYTSDEIQIVFVNKNGFAFSSSLMNDENIMACANTPENIQYAETLLSWWPLHVNPEAMEDFVYSDPYIFCISPDGSFMGGTGVQNGPSKRVLDMLGDSVHCSEDVLRSPSVNVEYNDTDSSVTVSWDCENGSEAAEGADVYAISLKRTPYGLQRDQASEELVYLGNSLNSNSVRSRSLTPGKTYLIYVRAWGSSGFSMNSYSKPITIPVANPTATPTPINTKIYTDVDNNQYVVGQGKETVVIYGKANEQSSVNVLNNIASSYWIKSEMLQVVFADVGNASVDEVRYLKNSIGCENIIYCSQSNSLYQNYNGTMIDLLYSAGYLGSWQPNPTYPVTTYYDKVGTLYTLRMGIVSAQEIIEVLFNLPGFELICPPEIPDAPQISSIDVISESSVSISWGDANNQSNHSFPVIFRVYNVTQSDWGEKYTLMAKVTDTSCTLTSLEPGKTYNFTVDAYVYWNGKEYESGSFEPQSVTMPAPTNTPTPLPSGWVAIDEVTFPDDNFRAYVETNYDMNKDGVLSKAEITSVTSFQMVGKVGFSDKMVSSLKGIEIFTNLESLVCSTNKLRELDVSTLTHLKELRCDGNGLTSLNLDNNTELEKLDCWSNSLTELDISHLINLTFIECAHNQLQTLAVGNLTNLRELRCYDNQITELDVSALVNLKSLYCEDNQISVLDVSNSPELRTLWCENNAISVLDLGEKLSLQSLQCYGNNIDSIEISVNAALYPILNDTYKVDSTNYTYYSGSKYDEHGPYSSLLLKCDLDTEIAFGNYEPTPTNTLTPTETPAPTPIENVVIDEDNFPDENFRSWVKMRADLDNNDVLSRDELDMVKDLLGISPNVKSLEGIEFFTNVENIACPGNKLDAVDVSELSKLKYLSCAQNPLSDLKLGKQPDLVYLCCTETILRTIDISDCPLLVQLVNETSPSISGERKYYNAPIYIEELNDTLNVSLECDLDTQIITEKLQFTPTPLPNTFVAVDKVNFPDDSFRNYVKNIVDHNQNNYLSSTEIAYVQEISIPGQGVQTLQGIQIFTNLETLNCSNNALQELDVSALENLYLLNCMNNSIAELGLTSSGNLEEINCANNSIAYLDVSGQSKLRVLDCSRNGLKKLDLGEIENLVALICYSNELTSLNVKEMTKLEILDCHSNNMNSLEVSTESTLYTILNDIYKEDSADFTWYEGTVVIEGYHHTLRLKGDEGIKLDFYDPSFGPTPTPMPISLDEFPDSTFRNYVRNEIDLDRDTNLSWEEITQVISLDLSEVPAASFQGLEYFKKLASLYINHSDLTTLDVSQNTGLVSLDCSDNALTSLVLGNNEKLESLNCSGNFLVSLDLSSCQALKTLKCSDNELQSLDVRGCSNLQVLEAHYNSLVKMDIPTSGYLKEVMTTENNDHEVTRYRKFSGVCGGNVNCTFTFDIFGTFRVDGSVLPVIYFERVSINEENFPDQQFRNYVRNQFDLNHDQVLSGREMAHVETIDISESSITSLKGISSFRLLENLNCSNNLIEELDVSFNVMLHSLDCRNNQLVSLKLGEDAYLEFLEYVSCNGNKLTSLDVSGCPNLHTLNCYYNDIGELDISMNAYLSDLAQAAPDGSDMYFSFYNGYHSLSYDLIVKLKADFGEVTPVVAFTAAPIDEEHFPDDGFRAYVVQFDKDQDHVLNWKDVVLVRSLDLYDNSFASIEGIENFAALRILLCQDGELTSLDVSNLPLLEQLDCSGNALTTLKVDGCTGLQKLWCYGNSLTHLDLTNTGWMAVAVDSEIIKEDEYGHAMCSTTISEIYYEFRCDYDLTIESFLGQFKVEKPATPTPTETPTPTATPTPAYLTDKSLEVGKSFQYPVQDVSYKDVTWSVGNTSVATVDQNGIVTGKSVGNTYLHVGLPDGTKIKCLIRVVYPTLKIRYSEKTLHINQTFQFTVSGDAGQNITWSVGNTSVATVDSSGKVTGKSAANTYLYAKSADGRVAKCLLKIVDPGTLGINYTEKTVYLGQSFTFTAKNAGILKPTWYTGNTSVATVDSSGKVTSVAVGNTYLYVKTEDGRSARCLVKVVDPGKLSITYTEKTVKVGQSFQFTAKNTAGQTVSWRVGNSSVATVDANGKVTGKSVANTYLYASTPDGRQVRCLIKVVA